MFPPAAGGNAEPVDRTASRPIPDRSEVGWVGGTSGASVEYGFGTEAQGVEMRDQSAEESEVRPSAKVEETLPAGIFPQVLDSLAEGCMVLGVDWTYLYVNEAAARHGRQKRENLLGRTILEMYPGVEDSTIFAHYRRSMEGRVHESFDAEFPFADGARHWYSFLVSPVPDGIFVLSLDITERRQVEESLEVKEAAIASSINGIAIADLSGRLTYVNDAFVRMWGYRTADEVVATDRFEYWQDPAAVAPVVEAVMTRGHWVGELLARRRDGSTFHSQVVTSRVDDKGGQPLCLLASFLDVSERKSAEENIRASEGRYRQIVETTHDGVWMIDARNRTTFVNQRMAEMLGYTTEEMVGQSVLAFVHDEERAEAGRRIAAASKGISESRERRFRRKDGSTLWALLAANPLFSADGTYSGAVSMVTDITERKRLEEALNEAVTTATARADELQALLDSVPALVFIAHDPLCRRMTANRAAENLMKVGPGGNPALNRPEGERPTTFRFLRDGRELLPAELPMERAAATGQPQTDVELTLDLGPGNQRHLVGSAVPLADDQGAVQGAVGAFIDISDYKLAKDSLRAGEEKYRRIVETAHEGIWLIDAEHRTTFVNRRMAEILGCTPDEMLGQPPTAFMTEESSREAEPKLDRARRGIAEVHERRYRRKDGSEVWTLLSTSPFLSVDGDYAGSLAMVSDITERKVAEAEVEHILRLYTALLELSEAVVRARSREELFGAATRIVVESGGFKTAWMGCHDPATHRIDVVSSHGDQTGYLDGIRVYADDRPEGRGPTGMSVREGRSVVFNDFVADPRTLPWREKAARAGWRSSAAFPVWLDGRTWGAFTVYAVDVNFFGDREVALLERAAASISFALDSLDREVQQRQAEGEVRRLNEELEQKVAERTAQLEAANRELEAFSYSVSHDLRAPLRAIEGFSGMLVKDGGDHLNAEDQRRLDVVRTNARRMSDLIDDLLNFSRVGRHEIRHGRVVMESLARSAFEDVAGDPEARARVDFRLRPLPDAEGDSTLIRQVWMNLLSNALKFSARQERPRIEVSGAVDGGLAVYNVRDNGAGFDPKYVDKLFGVFQRLHGPKEFEGTGIGLALVKRIVERHGGTVRAEGGVGEGATFHFSLPATKEAETAASVTVVPKFRSSTGG